MALSESLVLGTVVVTAAGLIGYRILKRKGKQLLLGEGSAKDEVIPAAAKIDTKAIMMITVSVLVLCSSLFVILSKLYDVESQKWAFGVIGTIVGFWLRPER